MLHPDEQQPPIKILRPLYALQLLILPEGDPFHTPKRLNLEQKLMIFAILTTICSFTMETIIHFVRQNVKCH